MQKARSQRIKLNTGAASSTGGARRAKPKTWVRGGAGMELGQLGGRRQPRRQSRGRRSHKLRIPPPLFVRMQQPGFWNARHHKEPIDTPDSTNNYLPITWTYSLPNAASYDLCYMLIASHGNVRIIRVGDNGNLQMFGNEHFLQNRPKKIRNMRQTLRLTNITRADSRAGYIRALKINTGFPFGLTTGGTDVSPTWTATEQTLTYLRNLRDTAENFQQYSAEQCAHGIDFSSKPSHSVRYRSYMDYSDLPVQNREIHVTGMLEHAGMETLLIFTPEVSGGDQNRQTFQVNTFFQDACTFDVGTMLGALMRQPPADIYGDPLRRGGNAPQI